MAWSSSSSVFLTNVDDYLAPSQACVNPLFSVPNSKDDARKEQQPTDAAVPFPRRNRQRQRQRQRLAPASASKQEDDQKYDSSNSNFISIVVVNPNITSQKDVSTTTTTTATSVVKATMADCLACSGCVTTAETVLVEQHSLTALRSICQEDGSVQEDYVVVVTISPAAWADILRHFVGWTESSSPSSAITSSTLSLEAWQRHLVSWWHRCFHVSMVIDGNIPLQWSLSEAAREFCRAYQQEQQGDDASDRNGRQAMNPTNPYDFDSLPSVALSATQAQYMFPDGSTQIVGTDFIRRRRLPLFASSCPAVVCMVEKSSTSSSSLSSSSSSSSLSSLTASIANLATTKSPMSIAGILVKHALFPQSVRGGQKTIMRRRVRHIAVMPCHDKKLEASRNDFLYAATDPTILISSSVVGAATEPDSGRQGEETFLEPSVDLVITTQEWWTLILETFEQQNQSKVDATQNECTDVNYVQRWIQSFDMAPVMNLEQYWTEQTQSGLATKEGAVFLCDHVGTTKSAISNPQNVPLQMENPEPPVFTIGSGGYADFVFRHAARHMFGHVISNEPLPWKRFSAAFMTSAPILRGRRRRLADSKPNDMYQICLYRHDDGSFSCDEKNPELDQVVLRFGIAYGLQNVQRVLQQQGASRSNSAKQCLTPSSSLSSLASPLFFDYVEAMACPMGCVNGGGQLRVAARETPTETRRRVANTQQIFSEIYNEPNVTENVSHNSNADSMQPNIGNGENDCEPINGTVAESILRLQASPSGPLESTVQQLLHTQYHVVPPLQHSQGATAGVAVSDLRW